MKFSFFFSTIFLKNVKYVTSHGKTYTNAFPLNGLKRWQRVGYPLGSHWKCWKKRWKCLENLLEVLRKAVEKLCAEPLKNPLGKFTQAILGVDSKQ